MAIPIAAAAQKEGSVGSAAGWAGVVGVWVRCRAMRVDSVALATAVVDSVVVYLANKVTSLV